MATERSRRCPSSPVGVGDDQRRDIGQTEQPRRRHRGPLLVGEDRRADVAGERFDMGSERRHLESDAAGIRLVGEEEIDKRGGLERAEVAVAIGHRAVGDLQEHLVDSLLVGQRRDDGAAEEMDHAGGPLEAAPHVEKSPARTARHALSAETGKGGEVEDQHVEEREDVPIMDKDDRSPADPGAVVGQGKVVASGQLWAGVPAAYVRDLSPAERAAIPAAAANSQAWAAKHAEEAAKPWEIAHADLDAYEQTVGRNEYYYRRLTTAQMQYKLGEVESHDVPGRILDSPIRAR
jgi:hypothetical protein